LREVLALARSGPEDTGLVLVDRRERETFVPWREIGEQAEILARGLLARGVERGDRVLLPLASSREFAVAFFGTVLAAAVPAPCPPAPPFSRADETRDRIEVRRAAIEARLVLDEAAVRDLLRAELTVALPVSSSEDLALVQFSSGTTSEPKAVALSHRAVTAQLDLLDHVFADQPGRAHVAVSWLPLHHDLGLVGFFLAAARRPARLVLLPPELFAARPSSWLRAISRHRATISAAPNFAYALAAARIRDEEIEGVDLSSWAVALNGAETVTERAMEAFAARFQPFGFDRRALTPVYGLAEATLAVTIPPLGRGPRVVERDGVRRVSVGRPLPGFAVEIGEGGRVLVSGPSLFERYWGSIEETERVLRGGVLDTGDLGFLEDGELYLTGRAKEVLVLRGENHSPETIEEAAMEVEGVLPGGVAAIAQLDDEALEERLVLYVERERDAACDADLARAVEDAVARTIGLRPARVIVLAPGRLPRTTSGKIRRGAIEAAKSMLFQGDSA
jgi:acyl-CoA synthetase (AMP-forming)/AMP-acid ligase II